MQNSVQSLTTQQPNHQSCFRSIRTICALLLAALFVTLGTGCQTVPKYEAPATRETVLERMRISEDNVDRVRWYRHKLRARYMPHHIAPMEIYIGQNIDQPQVVWLCLRTSWRGRRWAFLNGITINTDGTRHDWNGLDFRRDISSGASSVYVHEKLNITIDATQRQVIQAIIDSENAVLRFRGERGTHDFEIRAHDRLMYQDVLTAFDVLRETTGHQPN